MILLGVGAVSETLRVRLHQDDRGVPRLRLMSSSMALQSRGRAVLTVEHAGRREESVEVSSGGTFGVGELSVLQARRAALARGRNPRVTMTISGEREALG